MAGRKWWIAAVASAAWLGGSPGAQEPGSEPPNVVLIVADDLGYGDLGCYGGAHVATPHLDRIAREGLRFTDFHSNGAVCSPTRAALMTGRYQQRAGIEGVVTAARHRDTGLDLSEWSLAEAVGSHGHATALFGKWHLGYAAELGPVAQGFDEFRGFVSGNVDYFSHVDQEGHFDWWRGRELEDDEGHATDLINGYGVEFIEKHANAPFLLVLTHGAPHYPYQHRESAPFREVGKKSLRQQGVDVPAVHARMIAEMDEGIGKVLDALERRGIAERTLVFFMSDNGPARGVGSAGGLRGRKGSIWEGGHRVPAIAYWPGRIDPGESDALALGMDLLPTFVTLAAGGQTTTDRPLDGIDVSAHLLRREPLPARDAFWMLPNGARAIRRGAHKLVVTARDGEGRAELFDLSADLAEADDLAGDEPELARGLRAALEAWVVAVRRGVARRT